MAYKKSNPNGQATMANSEPVVLASDQASIPVTLQASSNNVGDIDVLTINGVAPAFGSGVRGATVQRVTISTDDLVPVSDNGGSLTIDAPVGTPVFVRLSDGASAISTLPVSLASVPSHAVTNAGTFAVQESGTQVQADDAVFIPATSKILMIGAEFDDVATDSVDEGDGGAVRMSANRNLYVRIRDNAGNERGLNIDANGALAATVTNATAANLNATVVQSGTWNIGTVTTVTTVSTLSDTTQLHPGTGATNLGKAEDGASADGDVGVGMLAVRKATPANTSGTDGDYEFLQISAGRLWASATIDAALPVGTNSIGKISDITTSIVPGTAATNLGKAEDAAHTTGDTGVAIWGVRNDNLATTYGADQDYAPIAVDLNSRVMVAQKAATATLSNVASSATSVTLLAANSARIGAMIYNDSTQSVYVKFGTTASSTSFTVLLATNTYYEIPAGYTGRIDGIWASANGNARVTEIT